MMRFSAGDIVQSRTEWVHMWRDESTDNRRAGMSQNMLVIATEPVYDKNGDDIIQNLTVFVHGEQWIVSSTNVIKITE